MKKISLIAALLLAFGFSFGQKGKKTETEPATTKSESTSINQEAHYRSIYNNAIKYNDFAVATQALYDLIAITPNADGLKDTLSQVYFQRGAWPQVILLTTEILEKAPDNTSALELQAIANQSIGRAKESLDNYEALYKRTKSPYHLYEIAALQYGIRRFGECEMSVNKLLSDPEIKDKVISISLQDGRTQEVPLTAAAQNLFGVMMLDQGRKDEAKAAFEKAVATFPDFLLAKNNLLELKK